MAVRKSKLYGWNSPRLAMQGRLLPVLLFSLTVLSFLSLLHHLHEPMKEYLELCLEGESSIPERKIILEKKRASLLEARKEIEDSIAFIDWKQNFYDEVLEGKTKYYSNLIAT